MTLNRAGRRSAIGRLAMGGATLALAACSTSGSSSSSAATVTQVLLDAQGAIATLKLVVAETSSYLGAASTTQANNVLAAASAAFASLTSATASVSTASTLSTIEGYLQAVVTAVVAALSVVPAAAPYLAAAQAVAALLPAIIAWVNSVIPPTATTSPAPAIAPRDYRPVRQTLGIPTLG